MNFLKLNFSLTLTILLLVPLALAFLSHVFYKNSSNKIEDQFAKLTGTVAGVSNLSVTDLTKELPLMPNAEIVSTDTLNDKTSITLESSQSEEEIKTFYEDYLFTNNWEKTGINTYKSDQKTLTINISGNIIKIVLTR